VTSLLEKRVARAVVGASYKLAKRLQTGVYRVAGSIRSIRHSSIRTFVIGVRQHLAIAIALNLSALLVLVSQPGLFTIKCAQKGYP